MAQNMKKPSVSLPESILAEIEERREKSENRSEYIRETLRVRFQAEDEGVWESLVDEPDGDTDGK